MLETIILNILSSLTLNTSKFALNKVKNYQNEDNYYSQTLKKTLKEFDLKADDFDTAKSILNTFISLEGVTQEAFKSFLNKEFPNNKISSGEFYKSFINNIHSVLMTDKYFRNYVVDNLTNISIQMQYLSKSQEKINDFGLNITVLLKTLHQISSEIKNEMEKNDNKIISYLTNFSYEISKQNELKFSLIEPEYQKKILDKISEIVDEIYPNIDQLEKNLHLYNEQTILRYGKLEFLGLPDFKEKPKIELEDIFVSLKSVESESDKQVQIEKVLNQKRKIVVLGDPGSGKSTLAKYIAIIHAKNKAEEVFNTSNKIPFLITLRHFANSLREKGSGYSISHYIMDHLLEDMNFKMDNRLLQYYLSMGKCIVIFDGLDELTHEELRFKIKKIVESFSISYPFNTFIVTSRITGYYDTSLDPQEFNHFKIQDFSDEQINKFIKLWYNARETSNRERDEKINSLILAIHSNKGVKRLASNPLMLTIIALVHRIEAELPNERVKLYDRCTEALITTWEKYKRTNIKNIGDTKKRRRLEKLAYEMQILSKEDFEQTEIKTVELKKLMKDILLESEYTDEDIAEDEANQFVEFIRKRVGILVERGHGIYSFVHLTFQEYFAACDISKRYISNLDQMWELIEPKLIDSRWNEVMLLLMGKLAEYDEPLKDILTRIINKNDPEYDNFIFDVLNDNIDMPYLIKINSMGYLIQRSLIKFDINQLTNTIVNPFILKNPSQLLININRLSHTDDFISVLKLKLKNEENTHNFFRHMSYINNALKIGQIASQYDNYKPSEELLSLIIKYKNFSKKGDYFTIEDMIP
ncbi:MAG: NACHT domain-containing protein [Candidatus Methanoperedens sp.]|jgi:predicted NACHT family NTPase|nr:NACHT domain-containing protein [Candidatus Methanoperedens sp.]PKL54555.1 MAG: hypothetical protein CVV36_01410 [Candidatus Methanoperedenaceae archaeon HGW-Methanoperedenaceae-1]